MTTTPDFRALCAEFIEVCKYDRTYTQTMELVARARAALATPPPELTLVAYIHRQGNHQEVSERVLDDEEKNRGWTEEPLYANRLPAPPPKPPTDDELDRCLLKADSDFMDSLSPFGGPFYHQAKDRFKARAVLERWRR